MPGGSVYKDHTFNKETAPTSHETAQYIHRNFHSTIQVHTIQYMYMNTTKYVRKQKIQKKRQKVQAFHECPMLQVGGTGITIDR
jgi:hypothetical protein